MYEKIPQTGESFLLGKGSSPKTTNCQSVITVVSSGSMVTEPHIQKVAKQEEMFSKMV